MSEIPILEIGAGGAFALLVIKEFRHWTTSMMVKKNGNAGNTQYSHKSSSLCNSHTESIAGNKTEIVNIKEVFRDMKKENKEDHNEIIKLIKNGGK